MPFEFTLFEVSSELGVDPDWFLTHPKYFWDWALIWYRVKSNLRQGPKQVP